MAPALSSSAAWAFSSSSTKRRLCSPPAIPITLHSWIRAIGLAIEPTAPAAAETTTVSPAAGRPTSSSPKYAGYPVIPSPLR